MTLVDRRFASSRLPTTDKPVVNGFATDPEDIHQLSHAEALSAQQNAMFAAPENAGFDDRSAKVIG